tara:strand:- start:46 stop:189 length:144 start_codon:yes stop_codon:yes gene_type:complete
MKEINKLLKRWIKNSIIRKEVRIVIEKEIEKAVIFGYEKAHDEVRAD